jgi:hypothetical protein
MSGAAPLQAPDLHRDPAASRPARFPAAPGQCRQGGLLLLGYRLVTALLGILLADRRDVT